MTTKSNTCFAGTKIPVLSLFKELEGQAYCLIKAPENIFDMPLGSDLDIFCSDIAVFSKTLLCVLAQYITPETGFVVQVHDLGEHHIHIDITQKRKINLRFDLYGKMPAFDGLLMHDALFYSIVDNAKLDVKQGVKLPSKVDDCLIRYLEYKAHFAHVPSKLKHLEYVLNTLKTDDERAEMLNKVHRHIHLPALPEGKLKSKNGLLGYIKSFKNDISKVKEVPLSQLPHKVLKRLRR